VTPPHGAPAPIRLVAFDLDGTLIRADTCCEALARPLGRLERMREFERRTTVEDIAAARVEMAGWYGGVPNDTCPGRLLHPQSDPGTLDPRLLENQPGWSKRPGQWSRPRRPRASSFIASGGTLATSTPAGAYLVRASWVLPTFDDRDGSPGAIRATLAGCAIVTPAWSSEWMSRRTPRLTLCDAGVSSAWQAEGCIPRRMRSDTEQSCNWPESPLRRCVSWRYRSCRSPNPCQRRCKHTSGITGLADIR